MPRTLLLNKYLMARWCGTALGPRGPPRAAHMGWPGCRGPCCCCCSPGRRPSGTVADVRTGHNSPGVKHLDLQTGQKGQAQRGRQAVGHERRHGGRQHSRAVCSRPLDRMLLANRCCTPNSVRSTLCGTLCGGSNSEQFDEETRISSLWRLQVDAWQGARSPARHLLPPAPCRRQGHRGAARAGWLSACEHSVQAVLRCGCMSPHSHLAPPAGQPRPRMRSGSTCTQRRSAGGAPG